MYLILNHALNDVKVISLFLTKFLHVLERLPKWITRIMGLLSAAVKFVAAFIVLDLNYLKVVLEIQQEFFHELLKIVFLIEMLPGLMSWSDGFCH